LPRLYSAGRALHVGRGTRGRSGLSGVLRPNAQIELYEFDPEFSRLVFPGWVLAALLEGGEKCMLYGDVRFCKDGSTISISTAGRNEVFTLHKRDVRVKETAWYIYRPGEGLLVAEIRTREGYVRLHSPSRGMPPTLLVNGIVMHRVGSGWDPLRDAAAKVSRLGVRRGHLVLDTCMGLGYTTIHSLRRGARVVTTEISRAVLTLAERNPFSKPLASSDVIILHGNAVDYVAMFESSVFDRVLHDPPRFSVAGSLYSQEFYNELYRILRPGGMMLHYTGEPQRGRGRGHGPIVRGVIERLRAAGFHVKGYDERTLSVLALKPRRTPRRP